GSGGACTGAQPRRQAHWESCTSYRAIACTSGNTSRAGRRARDARGTSGRRTAASSRGLRPTSQRSQIVVSARGSSSQRAHVRGRKEGGAQQEIRRSSQVTDDELLREARIPQQHRVQQRLVFRGDVAFLHFHRKGKLPVALALFVEDRAHSAEPWIR